MDPLTVVSVGLGALSIAVFGLAARSFRKGRRGRSIAGTGSGALLLSLSLLAGTLSVSTHGYRALTNETLALTVTTVPAGPQSFEAFVEFPDGRDTTLAVAGDQLQVDAHILKWHYVGNLLGLHTQYEMDRLTGRYADIEQERSAPRTVHSLKSPKPVDLFALVRRYSLLALLVDAEYGSGTFVDVREPSRFEVTVSTTGLLVREVAVP